MKKYILPVAFILSIFSFQFAHADIIPPGQKYVETCASLKGIAALPKLVIYARETGPTMQTPNVYRVNEGDCISFGYKFNSIDLYAVDSGYATSLTALEFDPASDTKAYKSDIQLDVAPMYVDTSSTMEYRHNVYLVAGVDNLKHSLVLLAAGYVSNSDTQETNPILPAGVDDHIQFSGTAFSDVPESSPYYNALVYLKNINVISGYDDGTFKPGNTINRAEFTKIIVGASRTSPDNGLCMETYGKPDGSYENLFSDVLSPKNSETAVWYLDYVCYAKTEHLVDGYPDGSFRPDQNINFVEAAKIIANAFQLQVIPPAASESWYKGYVDALAAKKTIPTTVTMFDKKITRGEMAEMAFRIKTGNTSLSSRTYADLQ